MPLQLTPTDALLIVDVQNDFCPGGLLPVPDGDQIIPVLNRWIEAAEKASVRWRRCASPAPRSKRLSADDRALRLIMRGRP